MTENTEMGKIAMTATNNKAYFGAYLNSATNNLNKLNLAFKSRYNIDKIESLINDTKYSEVKYKDFTELIGMYFPIIHKFGTGDIDTSLDKEERISYKYKLRCFLTAAKMINDLRCYFTHYQNQPLNFNTFNASNKYVPHTVILLELDHIIFRTTCSIRKNRLKTDKTKQLLKASLKETVQLVTKEQKNKLLKMADDKEQQAIEEQSEACAIRLRKEACICRRSAKNNDDLLNGAMNSAFNHILFEDKKAKTVFLKDLYKASYTEEECAKKSLIDSIKISENGLIWLMCAFLTKKEGEDFRSKLKYFKAKANPDSNVKITSLGFMVTHWLFGFMACKGFRHRLNTTFTLETLLTQIVDELGKVPNEVYMNLSTTNQERFLEDVNEFTQDFKEIKSLQSSTIIHPVIRKRYEDKFVYFAMRYLDEIVQFDNLRFQVHLGNYIKDKRVKNIEGTTINTEREVKERIMVFGRLSEVMEQKQTGLANIHEDLGWEEFPNPSYNLIGNNIPIYFLDSKRKKQADGAKSTSQKCKHVEKIISSDKIVHTNPTMLLSIHELPAILYEILVKKTPAKLVETTLYRFANRRRGKIEGFKNNNDLAPKGYPKQLTKAQTETSATINTVKLKNAIVRELVDTEARILECNQIINDNKERNYTFTKSEKGKIATWLANDIKRCMDVSNRKEWKSYHHNELQMALAFFGTSTDNNTALQLVTPFFNFKSNQKFIRQSLQRTTFDDMYKKYLYDRKKLYKEILDQTDTIHLDDDGICWSLFYKRLYTIKPKTDFIDALLKHPIVAPRGIFDEKPTYFKAGTADINTEPEKFADWYSFAHKATDFQSFYDLKLDVEQNYQLQYPDKKSDRPTLDKFKQQQLKSIRRKKTQDTYLMRIVNAIYKDMFKHDIPNSLSDLYISREERLRAFEKGALQNNRAKGDVSEVIHMESSFWEKRIHCIYDTQTLNVVDDSETLVPEQNVVFIEKNLKIKDLGKLKYHLKDKLVQRLLSLKPIINGEISDETWSMHLLQQELESYNAIRAESVFQLLNDVEKYTANKLHLVGQEYPKEFFKDGNVNYRYIMVNGLLPLLNVDCPNSDYQTLKDSDDLFKVKSVMDTISNEQVKKLALIVLIRNKFSHNEFPSIDYMNYIFDEVKTAPNFKNGEIKSYAEVLYYYLKQLIADLAIDI